MQILELINAAIHWFFRIWIVFGMAGGGALILRDELRLRQLQPRPEEIGSYADALVLRRGEEGVPRERNRQAAASTARSLTTPLRRFRPPSPSLPASLRKNR